MTLSQSNFQFNFIIMGGCLDKPKPKKPKVLPGTSKAPDSSKTPAGRMSIQEDIKKIEEVIPKYKKMSINELLNTYRIQSTLELCAKMQGPKYLSNIVDGSSKVLRVINLDEINEKRLQVYKKILAFQAYQNEEGTIMIIDQYCAGEDIYDFVASANSLDKSIASKNILGMFQQVARIISEFHKSKIWLGNLNLSSFKKKSAFEEQIRLVDINLHNQVGEYQKMGFAHKESFEADYQFLAYLLQFIVCDQPPIFIPHKIQYVEFETIPYSALVQKLLRGNPLLLTEIDSIKPQSIVISTRVLLGYKLRRDINKLLKMRKKRRAHNKSFYGQDIKELINDHRFQEDGVYRYETQRILERIKTYIEEIKSLHEESFINYAGNNDNIRRMKQVFLLTDKDKKMVELKECLSTIK